MPLDHWALANLKDIEDDDDNLEYGQDYFAEERKTQYEYGRSTLFSFIGYRLVFMIFTIYSLFMSEWKVYFMKMPFAKEFTLANGPAFVSPRVACFSQAQMDQWINNNGALSNRDPTTNQLRGVGGKVSRNLNAPFVNYDKIMTDICDAVWIGKFSKVMGIHDLTTAFTILQSMEHLLMIGPFINITQFVDMAYTNLIIGMVTIGIAAFNIFVMFGAIFTCGIYLKQRPNKDYRKLAIKLLCLWPIITIWQLVVFISFTSSAYDFGKLLLDSTQGLAAITYMFAQPIKDNWDLNDIFFKDWGPVIHTYGYFLMIDFVLLYMTVSEFPIHPKEIANVHHRALLTQIQALEDAAEEGLIDLTHEGGEMAGCPGSGLTAAHMMAQKGKKGGSFMGQSYTMEKGGTMTTKFKGKGKMEMNNAKANKLLAKADKLTHAGKGKGKSGDKEDAKAAKMMSKQNKKMATKLQNMGENMLAV